MLKTLRILFQDYKRQMFLSENIFYEKLNFLKIISLIFSIRMTPIILYRLSCLFYKFRITPISNLFSILNRFLFGLEISKFTEIGPGLCIPHPLGVVIGAKSIGSNCIVFQGVTIGSKEIDFIGNKKLRPEIGENVTIGSGAKILGSIRIADYTVIGANAVVLNDIKEPGFKYGGIPAKKLSQNE